MPVKCKMTENNVSITCTAILLNTGVRKSVFTRVGVLCAFTRLLRHPSNSQDAFFFVDDLAERFFNFTALQLTDDLKQDMADLLTHFCSFFFFTWKIISTEPFNVTHTYYLMAEFCFMFVYVYVIWLFYNNRI